MFQSATQRPDAPAAGYALVAEVYGLRSVQLGASGEALDLGITGGRLVNPAGLLLQP